MMDRIRELTVAGLLYKNSSVIRELILKWYGKVRLCVSKTLLETTPTYLYSGLVLFINEVFHLKTLLRKSLGKLEGEQRVYDLVESGPRNQFMVGRLIAHNCSYGAGAKKIYDTLRMQGIDVTFEQVQDIHAAYWKLFKGIKDYQKVLEQEWKDRRGWIRNGIGRPLAVDERRLKDLVNTNCQATGHDCLIFYVDFLAKRLETAGIEYSWVVVDYHDETIIEVAEGDAEAASDCMNKAFDDLNKFLQGDIPLAGEPCIAHDFKPFKLD